MKSKKLLLWVALLIPALLTAQGQERKTNKLEWTVEPGFMFGVGEGNSAKIFTVTAGMGTWLTPQLYTGVHGGAWIPTAGDAAFPLFARLEYKLDKESVEGLSLQTDWGYMFNSGAGLIGIMPTYTFAPADWCNLKVGVGYNVLLSSGNAAHAIGTRVGWQLTHKRPKKVPVRDSGLQYTIEGGFTQIGEEGASASGNADLGREMSPIFGIALTYKYDPHISFGFVYQWEGQSNYALRGQYRLNDNRFSPIGCLDMGIRTLSDWENKPKSFFVTPAIGASLRSANNSYWEIKLGYKIGTKATIKEDSGKYIYTGDVKNTGIFLSIGWTHTLKWLQRD